MNDWLTGFIVNIYESFGLGALFFAAMGFFFGVSGFLALIEYWFRRDVYRNYYEDRDDIHFHRNFSTLVDYLLLNPLVIVVVASVTAKMQRLPVMLAPMFGGEPTVMATLGDRYLSLLSPWWLVPLVLCIACVGWFMYSHELAQKERSKVKFWTRWFTGWHSTLTTIIKEDLLTEWYIVLATVVMMVVSATFLWRVGVLGWYLSSVTKAGLTHDLLLWSIGLGDIADVVSRLNLFFVLLTAIVAVMALHDFLLYKGKRSNRKVRILGFGIILLLTIVVLVIPVWTIHEHLVAAKSEWVRGLLALRVVSTGGERAGIEELVRAVRNLPDWPVGTTGSVLTVVGQLIMLALPAYLDASTRGGGLFFLPKRQESTAAQPHSEVRSGNHES